MSKKKKLEREELGLCVHLQHESDNDKDKLLFPPTREMQMETKTRKVPQELGKKYLKGERAWGQFCTHMQNMNMITMTKMSDSTHLQDKHHGK
jgi:hypothetical protein